MNVIDPRGMKAMEWIDRTAALLDRFVTVMKAESDDDWREWGSHVMEDLRRAGVEVPDPFGFSSWDLWADRFNQVISEL